MRPLGFKSPPSTDEMYGRLAELSSAGEIERMDYVVSTCHIANPERYSIHTGNSWEVQRPILEANWNEIVGLISLAYQDSSIGRIFIFCRSGKHRSVAYARFLIRVLQDLGVGVVQRHYCDWLWLSSQCMRKCRPEQCSKCFGEKCAEHEEAMVALSEAVEEDIRLHE